MYSHPSSLSVLSVVSRFIAGVFSCPSVPYRDSVSVLSVSGALWSDAEAIHECILSCLELSHAARQIAHIRQSRCVVGFQPGSCVPVVRNSSRAKVDAVTVRLSPQLALPVSQRTADHVPDKCGSRGPSGILFDNKSGAPPGTTCTRSTPWTPAIPTGSMARVLVSSVSSLPNRKVLAFLSWILCVLRHHLRVSICSHFSRVFCPIRKREHPVSITPFPM